MPRSWPSSPTFAIRMRTGFTADLAGATSDDRLFRINAEHVDERVHDLALGGVRLHRLEDVRHQVVGPGRGHAQPVQRRRAPRLVALRAHRAHSLDLLGLEPWIDAEDLDRRLPINRELVDPDHDPLLLLELLLVAERRVRDLFLEEAGLDRRYDAAKLLDALEVRLRLALDLVGERFDEVAAAEGVDRACHASLVCDQLLRAQRE